MSRGFKVRQAGGLALLQDKGRMGVSQFGVAQSGCADPLAYFWSNHLLANADNLSVIEITLGAFALESQIDTCIAVCGADLSFTINGQKAPLWQTINIKQGDQLTWGKRVSGLRSYLAVKGGFLCPLTLNSVATNMREKMGGLYGNGEALKTNDTIPCKPTPHQTIKSLSTKHIPIYTQAIKINFIPSYQFHQFNQTDRLRFVNVTFTVSPQIDRVGYRLQGTPLPHNMKLPYSEAMLIGAIQIPTDGYPIIMLNDAPTIGGYPKIGTICPKDLYKLAQTYSGDTITFNLNLPAGDSTAASINDDPCKK